MQRLALFVGLAAWGKDWQTTFLAMKSIEKSGEVTCFNWYCLKTVKLYNTAGFQVSETSAWFHQNQSFGSSRWNQLHQIWCFAHLAIHFIQLSLEALGNFGLIQTPKLPERCQAGIVSKKHVQHMQFTSSQDIFVDFRLYYRILKGCVECSGRSPNLYGKRTLLQRLPKCSEKCLAVPEGFFCFLCSDHMEKLHFAEPLHKGTIQNHPAGTTQDLQAFSPSAFCLLFPNYPSPPS